jgi:predicted Zn-dependent protease
MARSRAGVCLAAALALASAQPATALPFGSGGFSVSGKKGPFIKQVSGRNFAQSQGGAAALGLASDAVNQGQYQAARLRMPQTEARIRQLLEQIEASWPYPKLRPVQVYVLGVDFYTAQALPDGSIVVGFGLLDRAQSDDELAFVLGHELSHIRLGHFAKADVLKGQREMASRLGQLYVVGATLHNGVSGFRSSGLGGGVSAVAGGSNSAARQAEATNDLLHFITNVVVEPAWSREQEDEADALGFDLSEAGRYSAETASARVFDTIQADREARRSLSDTLRDQLKKQLGQVTAHDAADTLLGGGEGIKRALFRGAGRLGLGVAGSAEGGPKHRPPEERKKGIADYSTDAYPQGLPLQEEKQVWLTALRSTREYAEAKATVGAVGKAMKLRASGDLAGAEREIAPALRTSFATAPLVLNESARIRDDRGDIDGAAQLFARAHQSPDQTVDGYLDHARMLYRAGRYDPAMQVLKDGAARFRDDKPFLSLQVAVAKGAGQSADADGYLRRCNDTGDAALKKDCQLAAGGPSDTSKSASPFRLPKLPF